jgi:exodeoxyribonuclease VII large subunit
MGVSEPRIYTVSELTRCVKSTLEDSFGSVWVEGELSNVRRPASGHVYFTIKDENAQIRAVLFRGAQRGVPFSPVDGVLVRAFGELTVYERSGEYQIIVRRMLESGRGALHARFEALKEKLLREGLFAEERKRPIPVLPQHIGVVTSSTGAAIRDILNVISRRFPNLHVLLHPVRVQGDGAAGEIAAAIDTLNARGGLDVLIVGRGGGSLEDLWCFNEEAVARAIARSRIPVISAVGHEIDYTISDFTADLRAATPSAAAELVVDRKEAFEEALDQAARRAGRALSEALAAARSRLAAAERSYVFREPRNLAAQYRERLGGLQARIARRVEGRLREGQQAVDDLGLRLLHEMRLRRERAAQDIRRLGSQLQALNPLRVLERGYSITRDAEGRVLRSAAGLAAGDRVETTLAHGRLRSQVLDCEAAEPDEQRSDNLEDTA